MKTLEELPGRFRLTSFQMGHGHGLERFPCGGQRRDNGGEDQPLHIFPGG